MLRKKEIIVVMGGAPLLKIERRHSIDYGNIVIDELNKLGLSATPLEIKKITDLNKLIGKKNIIVFNALIGLFGEDGEMASFLEYYNIPYTGCTSLSAKITFNKFIFKLLVNSLGINTPPFQIIESKYLYNNKKYKRQKLNKEHFYNINKETPNIKYPVMVKTLTGGFSLGYTKVENENNLHDALIKASKYGNKILLEKFIEGRDAHVPIINGETLEIIETSESQDNCIRKNDQFYDFQVRDKTYFIPGRFSGEVIAKLKAYTSLAYSELNLNGLCRADYIVSKNDEVFILEINSQHSIRKNRMAINSAKAVGYKEIDLINKILSNIN